MVEVASGENLASEGPGKEDLTTPSLQKVSVRKNVGPASRDFDLQRACLAEPPFAQVRHAATPQQAPPRPTGA